MFDAIVIGGSYAGMSAVLQLARARQRVLVVDAGLRRNRFADHSHGFLGHDGMAPDEIASNAKKQVLAYPTVTWREGKAEHARKVANGFEVSVGGEQVSAKRLLIAAGIVDELPTLPGVRERWGKTIAHCPYCHGYELGQKEIAVLATSPMSIHHALMLPDWGKTTFFTNGAIDLDPTQMGQLKARGVTIETTLVKAIEGDDTLIVRLADGSASEYAGMFLMPFARISTPIPVELGCEIEPWPMGEFVKTDPMTRETTVTGVFACGDVAMAAGSVAFAVGDGARAGVGVHRSLVFEGH